MTDTTVHPDDGVEPEHEDADVSGELFIDEEILPAIEPDLSIPHEEGEEQ